jgi:hypothetical protein
MGTTNPATRLRHRADELRRFANRVEATRLVSAYVFAGDDTWVGPTPAACLSDLVRLRRNLLTQCDGLRVAARRLDRAADAMAAAAPVGGR